MYIYSEMKYYLFKIKIKHELNLSRKQIKIEMKSDFLLFARKKSLIKRERKNFKTIKIKQFN